MLCGINCFISFNDLFHISNKKSTAVHCPVRIYSVEGWRVSMKSQITSALHPGHNLIIIIANIWENSSELGWVIGENVDSLSLKRVYRNCLFLRVKKHHWPGKVELCDTMRFTILLWHCMPIFCHFVYIWQKLWIKIAPLFFSLTRCICSYAMHYLHLPATQRDSKIDRQQTQDQRILKAIPEAVGNEVTCLSVKTRLHIAG